MCHILVIIFVGEEKNNAVTHFINPMIMIIIIESFQ